MLPYKVLLTLWSFMAATNALTRRAIIPGTSSPDTGSPVRTVYQFANGTWVENIASSANGNLLVTLTDRPELYEINPRNHDSARLIHRFEGYKSLLGIAETSKNVFAIVAGNFSLTSGTEPGSFSVWRVALGGQTNEVAKVTDIPDAVFLNGMTALKQGSNAILISDCSQGVVYRVDVNTGKYSITLSDTTFLPPQNATFPIGINGIRLHQQHLYYSNTFQQLFGRIPINTCTGEATGAYEVFGTAFGIDDFALDERGQAYVAAGFINEVYELGSNGKSRLIAGQTNSTLVEGATSGVFGRTSLDKGVLYITTSGGQASVLDGISIEGGKIVALLVN